MGSLPSITTYSDKGSDAGHDAQSPTLGGSGGSSPTTPRTNSSAASVTTNGSRRGLLKARKYLPSWNGNSSKSGSDVQHGLGLILDEANLGSHNSDSSDEPPLDRGWPLLARVMEKYPEFEAFARFRELHVKNLLYYQVELDYIREELEFQENLDWKLKQNQGADDMDQFSKCADVMVRQAYRAKEKGGKGCKQWDLVIKLRETLHGYDEAVLQYAKVSALPEPSTRNIQELRNWIIKPNRGNYTISGNGSSIWGELYDWVSPDETFKGLFQDLAEGLMRMLFFWWRDDDENRSSTRSDLVVPRPQRKIDAIDGWIAYSFFPWMGRLFDIVRLYYRAGKKMILPTTNSPIREQRRQEHMAKKTRKKNKRRKGTGNPKLDNITFIPVTSINRGTSFVSTIVACVVPTLAIAVLTTTAAQSKVQKLMWIGGFTVLFAMGLTAFASEISRVQIFMAAAAFSAVLVVFIQN